MLPLHDDNPTDITPFVTLLLMGLCIFGFIWQQTLGPEHERAIIYGLGLVPAVLWGTTELPPALSVLPSPATLVSSMFLHGDIWHLGGNMLFLWVFGNNVEDAMGHLRFVAFYLLCGIAAALMQATVSPESTIPMIGASGAISGVLGAYLLLYPNARILVGIPIVIYLHLMRLSALWVLIAWFVMVQMVSSALSNPDTGGVAWYAHIGGFIAGFVLIPVFKYRHLRLLHPGNVEEFGTRADRKD